jgi:hypothetical protein
MVTQQQRNPFVYGKFRWGPAGTHFGSRERVAIEVLREFSATEFVGKLYLMSGSPPTWSPADMHKAEEQEWYAWYTRISKSMREKGSGFYFEMEGAVDSWKVLYIRGESDDAGPYVAIALRY